MIIEKINQIPICEILDKFGFEYKIKGDIIELFENGKKTDGWKGSISKNFINDNNKNKNRLTGDVYQIIKTHLNFDDKQAILWAKNEFNITDNFDYNTKPVKSQENLDDKVQIDFKEKFEGYRNLNNEQKKYLDGRGIKTELLEELGIIKDNNFLISCPILNIKGDFIGIQNRNINEKFEIRYKIEKGSNLKGYFYKNINKEDKRIIILEGLTDFLSLRQYYSNVLALVSGNCDLNDISLFHKKGYKIYLISDNDDVGNDVRGKLSEILENDLYFFDLKKYESDDIKIKDFNDFLKETGFGEGIEELIFEESEYLGGNDEIEDGFNKLNFLIKTIREKGKLGRDTAFPVLDKFTGGFIKGKVYLLGGFSNSGKSNLMYEFINFDIKKGLKVGIFSLEVGKDFLLINLLKNKYKKNFKEVSNLDLDYKNYKDYFKNTKIYDEKFELYDIIETIKKEKFDIVYIDFLQNIQVKGTKDEYQRMSEIALQCQLCGIKTGTTFFNLSQLNNTSRFEDIKNATFKGSGSLYFSSDVIFVIKRGEVEGELELYIEKNKFGKRGKMFDLYADFDISSYKLFEQEQEKNEVII